MQKDLCAIVDQIPHRWIAVSLYGLTSYGDKVGSCKKEKKWSYRKCMFFVSQDSEEYSYL